MHTPGLITRDIYEMLQRYPLVGACQTYFKFLIHK